MTATATADAPARPANRLGFVLLHIYVLGICAVLLGGFLVQFGRGEYPCPLCILQRMFMMLAALGPVFVIARSRTQAVTTREFAAGYGMSIVASVCGAAVAARHIMLHIKPPDPGYGSTVWGLHPYTWAFITFTVAILAAGGSLALARELEPLDSHSTALSTTVLWIFGAIVLANLLAVFALEGLHWFLPGDPIRYQLLHDLGITS
ncbi:disulfide bond formation protein B [Amycolatopsis halotolerans]|uniref:Disulfide bond formation protein B n=1 Tax=Amycolatopsis halotolerans TaxID=330083 RepID=A0ABV7QCJ1_9PSEU